MPYKTLGELRSSLLGRLGMGGMGASGGANQSLIDGFLQSAQRQLYWLQDWRRLQDYLDISTGVGQNLYDYPATGVMTGRGCAQDQRILKIELKISGQWVQLKEGITTEMWSTMDMQTQPQRYERLAQILVYPKAGAVYTIRVWFVADLMPFTQESHRATIDDEMILLHAIATAKNHYRQPDAKIYEGQLNTLLAQIRGQSFGANGVYRRGAEAPREPKPAVVGRDI